MTIQFQSSALFVRDIQASRRFYEELLGQEVDISAMAGHDEQEFRQACIEGLTRSESLDFMIDTLKDISTEIGGKAP